MHFVDVSTINTLEITLLDLPRSSCYKNLSSNRKNDFANITLLHTMIGSPVEAHPLPGSSRFFTSEKDYNVPPPYAAQQTPPPYSSSTSNRALSQPCTRSVPFASSVITEWSPNIPRSPDGIIYVTVKINRLDLKQSFDEDLPQR